jgi:SAM-dependent methyltransferase
MPTITTLAETPIGASTTDLEQLFEPFVADDPDIMTWHREARRRRVKLLRRFLKPSRVKAEAGARSLETVQDEYERSWERTANYPYSAEHFPRNFTPWLCAGRKLLASDVGATRFRQALLVAAIELVQPRRVLEIGCGNGINLMLLAGRFPEVAFHGLELTAAGVAASRGFQAGHARLPEPLQAYAPRALYDPTAFRRVMFTRGNAAALPYPDASFDFVYSCLALEQMEAVRERALDEMARVTSKWAFNVEPFADVNNSLWSWLYVTQRGYFRGRIDELRHHGLEPQWATMDFPQELFLKSCAVMSKKSPVAG